MAMRGGLPRDECHFVLAAYFVLGVGSLLVWNAVITALDFFEMLYPPAFLDGFRFSTLMPVVFTPANLASLVVMLCVPFRMDHSLIIRVGFAFCLATLAMAIGVDRCDGGSVHQHCHLGIRIEPRTDPHAHMWRHARSSFNPYGIRHSCGYVPSAEQHCSQ